MIVLIERKVKVGTGLLRVDRVRKGKVQRKKVISSRKGYKVAKGKSVRQSPSERRKRKVSAKRGARKRAAKLSRILIKRKISIKRGKRQGLYN